MITLHFPKQSLRAEGRTRPAVCGYQRVVSEECGRSASRREVEKTDATRI